MQAYLPRLLAVRDVESEWTDRRAHARTDTIPDDERRRGNFIERIAGVDEGRNAPGLIDPACRFEAAHHIVTARHRCVAVLDAEAFESITAHRGIAASAPQQRRWHFLARCAEHTTRLQARRELIIAADRIP